MDVVSGSHVITTGGWGSGNPAFTVSRGSRGAAALHVFGPPPLYWHAAVPPGFRRRVSRRPGGTPFRTSPASGGDLPNDETAHLGVYGDGVAGLEPEGVECPAGARVAASCGGAPGGVPGVAADGVRDVPRRGDRDAMPGRPGREAPDLSAAVVDAVAGGVPAAGGAPAGRPAVLRPRP